MIKLLELFSKDLERYIPFLKELDPTIDSISWQNLFINDWFLKSNHFKKISKLNKLNRFESLFQFDFECSSFKDINNKSCFFKNSISPKIVRYNSHQILKPTRLKRKSYVRKTGKSKFENSDFCSFSLFPKKSSEQIFSKISKIFV